MSERDRHMLILSARFQLILALAFVLAFFPPAVHGQPQKRVTLRHVDVIGNTQLRRDDLINILQIKVGEPLAYDWSTRAVPNLLAWYRARGFLLARVDSIQTDTTSSGRQCDILIWLKEGEPIKIGRLKIEGIKARLRHDLEDRIETRSGDVFREVLLESDIENILSYFEDNGYPLARVSIDSMTLRDTSRQQVMDVRLVTEPGPAVRIDTIRITGNKLTKERVVLREIRLKPGDLYRHNRVQDLQEILQRLRFFNRVDPPFVRFLPEGADLTIRVEEGNANTIDGVLGYTPSKVEGEQGFFTGRLQLTFRNLMGTGRFLEAFWEKKDAHSQAMRFEYEEPWLLGLPLHVSGSFAQEIRDTLYVERSWHAGLRYTPWSTLSLSLSGGQRAILPDSLGGALFDLVGNRTWFVSAGIDYNGLDDPINPMRGVRYRTTVETGRKRYLDSAISPDNALTGHDFHTSRIHVDAEGVLPVFRRQVLYLGLHGVEVKTGEAFVPLPDQIRFGGAMTVRGYREDAFRGSLVAWANIEFRALLGRGSRAFVFVDAGAYQRREPDAGLVRSNMIGYGVGVRIETRLGAFGVDFGLGEGDSFMQGKIHVGLVNRF